MFSKELAKPKPGERWLLVTSAQHMPRAIGVFRQAGFAVEAYPVAWQTGLRPDFEPSLNIVGNLSGLDAAAYEWVGLAAYWFTGKSAALFPAPERRRRFTRANCEIFRAAVLLPSLGAILVRPGSRPRTRRTIQVLLEVVMPAKGEPRAMSFNFPHSRSTGVAG